MTVAMQTGLAFAGGAWGAEPAASEIQTAPARTIKERLGSKASDEQRVNNCKVPLALRGPKPRPDGCQGTVSTAPKR